MLWTWVFSLSLIQKSKSFRHFFLDPNRSKTHAGYWIITYWICICNWRKMQYACPSSEEAEKGRWKNVCSLCVFGSSGRNNTVLIYACSRFSGVLDLQISRLAYSRSLWVYTKRQQFVRYRQTLKPTTYPFQHGSPYTWSALVHNTTTDLITVLANHVVYVCHPSPWMCIPRPSLEQKTDWCYALHCVPSNMLRCKGVRSRGGTFAIWT